MIVDFGDMLLEFQIMLLVWALIMIWKSNNNDKR